MNIYDQFLDVYQKIDALGAIVALGSGGTSTVSANLDSFNTVALARAAVVPNTYFRLVVVKTDEENSDEFGTPLTQTIYYKSSTAFRRVDITQSV